MKHKRASIQISPEEQTDFIEKSRIVTISTNGHNGYPHPMPMWYIVRDGMVHICTYGKSQKMANIRRDDRVSLLVESGDAYNELKGLVIRGRAEIIEDQDYIDKTWLAITRKYQGPVSPEMEAAVIKAARKRLVVRVRPEHTISWDHAKIS